MSSGNVPQGQLPHAADKLVRLTREDDYEKRWIVVGKHGAIDFHCSLPDLEVTKRFGRIGGVEYHHRAPTFYMGEDYACTNEQCWVLGGKCWHDGTSHWASNHWIPMLEALGEPWVWSELEATYRSYAWPVSGTVDQTVSEASPTVPSAAPKD